MSITKTDKEILKKAIQSIDVKKLYEPVEDEEKRKWFRFGAFDALRMVTEMLESYPEDGNNTKHIGIKIANPNE